VIVSTVQCGGGEREPAQSLVDKGLNLGSLAWKLVRAGVNGVKGKTWLEKNLKLEWRLVYSSKGMGGKGAM